MPPRMHKPPLFGHALRSVEAQRDRILARPSQLAGLTITVTPALAEAACDYFRTLKPSTIEDMGDAIAELIEKAAMDLAREQMAEAALLGLCTVSPIREPVPGLDDLCDEVA